MMFTDNDELSGLIASMMDAETLVILSNIDGIYDGSPTDPSSHVISKVEPGKDLSQYIQSERSGFGRGGMITKYNIARKMAEEGIFVTGFYYPVVPKGQARIRVQLSAAHKKEHLDKAIAAFVKVGKELGVIK